MTSRSPTRDRGGSSFATFTLRLSDTTRTLNLIVSTASGTATAASGGSGCGPNADYLPLNSVGVNLSPTVRVQTVNVPICGDALDEDDQFFLLRISQASGTPIQDSEARATIIDDDPAPSLWISDVNVAEGGAGTTREANFTFRTSAGSGRLVPMSTLLTSATFQVSLTGTPLGYPLTFNYATDNITATAGTACLDTSFDGVVRRAGDYIAKPGTETLPVGQTSMTIAVSVCKLRISRGESFSLRIFDALGIGVGNASGTATVP